MLINLLDFFALEPTLARQAQYHLSHALSPFYIGYFEIVLLYSWFVLPHVADPSICAFPHSWDDRHMLPHPAID
jgi:hypothetical protein